MTQLTDDNLLIYNKEGLIPGPTETTEEFIRRAEYCKQLRDKLSDKLPFTPGMEAPPSIIQAAGEQIAKEYDIAPTWVPVFYSNYQLMPWHGGCAWIFQLDDQQPTAAFLQLRKAFSKSKAYWGIYNRNELMEHELVHIGRMMFEEPKFEEMLAYRTSKKPWRRLLGPIVQSSGESALFVFLLLPILFLDIYLLASGHESYYWKAMWLKLLPLGMLAAGLARLWKKRSLFESALSNLISILGDTQKAQAVIFRLTDKEIEDFAHSNQQQIFSYAQANKTLRWRLIRLAYLERV